jgi:hypothetical protein
MTRQLRAHILGIAAATLLGALWLLWRGPAPVVRGTEVRDATVPFWYMISAFPFFGILLAESWLEWPTRRGKTLLVQLLIIVLISILRLTLFIPISGHLLLLSFFLLWTMNNLEQPYLTEYILGVGVLMLLVYTKVFVWQDAMTAVWGVAMAFVIWWVGQRLAPIDAS